MKKSPKSAHPLRPGLLDMLAGYDRQQALADGTAGAITAILLIPQAMAYALLAGLPAQYGLYAAVIPPVVYALFGTSRTLAVGPVAVAALMVADALAGYAGTEGEWIEGAIVLSAEVGILLLIAGLLGLGRLVASVSYVDSSGLSLLENLDTELGLRGIELHLTEVKGPVADRLSRVTALEPLFAERVHLSLERAVQRLEAE